MPLSGIFTPSEAGSIPFSAEGIQTPGPLVFNKIAQAPVLIYKQQYKG